MRNDMPRGRSQKTYDMKYQNTQILCGYTHTHTHIRTELCSEIIKITHRCVMYGENGCRMGAGTRL
jgi:hypothetical protein